MVDAWPSSLTPPVQHQAQSDSQSLPFCSGYATYCGMKLRRVIACVCRFHAAALQPVPSTVSLLYNKIFHTAVMVWKVVPKMCLIIASRFELFGSKSLVCRSLYMYMTLFLILEASKADYLRDLTGEPLLKLWRQGHRSEAGSLHSNRVRANRKRLHHPDHILTWQGNYCWGLAHKLPLWCWPLIYTQIGLKPMERSLKHAK